MRTTISLSPETKKKLSDVGKHGESYEDILLNLLDKQQARIDLNELIKSHFEKEIMDKSEVIKISLEAHMKNGKVDRYGNFNLKTYYNTDAMMTDNETDKFNAHLRGIKEYKED